LISQGGFKPVTITDRKTNLDTTKNTLTKIAESKEVGDLFD